MPSSIGAENLGIRGCAQKCCSIMFTTASQCSRGQKVCHVVLASSPDSSFLGDIGAWPLWRVERSGICILRLSGLQSTGADVDTGVLIAWDIGMWILMELGLSSWNRAVFVLFTRGSHCWTSPETVPSTSVKSVWPWGLNPYSIKSIPLAPSICCRVRWVNYPWVFFAPLLFHATSITGALQMARLAYSFQSLPCPYLCGWIWEPDHTRHIELFPKPPRLSHTFPLQLMLLLIASNMIEESWCCHIHQGWYTTQGALNCVV